MADEFCVVFVTVGKAEEAERIAEAVVAEKLAACANLLPGVRSIYRWKGQICRDAETMMVLKTRRGNFERLRARVRELHSYEVPEIIAVPIVEGHGPYMDWLRDETA
jgi:periplasmic divalent cation tolerance protein